MKEELFYEKIIQAQGEILRIINDFESECGVVVEDIELRSLDVTRMEDSFKRIIRDVFLSVRPNESDK